MNHAASRALVPYHPVPLPVKRLPVALVRAAPRLPPPEHAGDARLRRRLDLLRLRYGEREAALAALALGRDIGRCLEAIGRCLRGMIGRKPRAAVQTHGSYLHLVQARRLLEQRRAMLLPPPKA